MFIKEYIFKNWNHAWWKNYLIFWNMKFLLLLIDPPSVTSFNTQYPTELSDLSIRCSATAGNPSNHVYYWTRSGDDSFRKNNTYLRLNGIRRNESGSYICTAVNFYSTGGEGKDSKTLSVNVQCKKIFSYYVRLLICYLWF